MMHNSIWIRDILRSLNQDPLHIERRDPHRGAAARPIPSLTGGEFRLDGKWSILGRGHADGVEELAEDLEDFLGRMGVAIGTEEHNTIDLSIIPTSRKGYHLSMHPGQISISSGDMEGLWAGGVRLEREMARRRGPYLPQQDIEAQPGWDVQISQAPWGSNYLVPDLSPEYLGDDAFRLLAHYGVKGMTIYGDILFYVRSEVLPELNHPEYESQIATLRLATERASRYGISLYLVPVLPKLAEEHPVFLNHPGVKGARFASRQDDERIHTLCSSDQESLAFYAGFVSNLFEEVPLLGGLILIVGGESFYHCYMRPAGRNREKGIETNCPRCSTAAAEEVVAGFVANVSHAAHRVKPEAIVVAWPYSAFIWSEDPDQLGLIERLPADSGLLSEIDKDHLLRKEGYTKAIWDYSVDFAGPSDRILRQAAACRARNLALYVKTETAIGLEAIHVPYVPCMHRLRSKWENVCSLNPKGVLQSWMFFGMWGSRAEELGWWARWNPDVDGDGVLSIMARRDFGEEACELIVSAWRKMSEAVGHLPSIPPYFMGPWFLGPAHALAREGESPSEFEGALYYLQESEVSLSKARLDIMASLLLSRLPDSPSSWGMRADQEDMAWDKFAAESDSAARLSGESLRLMKEAGQKTDDPSDALALAEELTLIEYLHRTFVSVANAVKWLRSTAPTDEGELRGVLESELENAVLSRSIYDRAPWLDLSLRADGRFPSSASMLDSKIRLLRQRIGYK